MLECDAFMTSLGKPQKKRFLMAGPLREGREGGKGRAIKEKITF